MSEDDHLYVRCLMVVLMVAGGVLSTLLLVPPPESAWDTGLSAGSQPLNPEQFISVHIMPFARPSHGPRPFPAPIQTGESALSLAEKLVLPQPHLAHPDPRPSSETTVRVNAGPLAEMTLSTAHAHPSPAAITSGEQMSGGDPGTPGQRMPPPPPVVTLPARERLSLDPEHIMALRPVTRIDVHASLHGEIPASTQDTAEDPLPEFRRYRPRFEACAREFSRRNRVALSGKVLLKFTVDERGAVSGARAVRGSLSDVEASDCLVSALQSERLFAARAEPVTAERAVIFTR